MYVSVGESGQYPGINKTTGAQCLIRRADDETFRKGSRWDPVHCLCTECSDEFRQTLVKFSECTSQESHLLDLLRAPVDGIDDAVHISSSWLRAEKRFIVNVIKSRVRYRVPFSSHCPAPSPLL